MPDFNYWKDRYQQQWPDAAKKEQYVIEQIRRDTGLEVLTVGFGAGSSQYLAGPAAEHQHEKGAADLRVAETNVYLEVTGPFSKSVPREAPLWVRPDKLEHARRRLDAQKTIVVHVLAGTGELRVISLNDYFFERLDAGEFATVQPTIRGTTEQFIAIPAAHSVVRPWSRLVDFLRTAFLQATITDASTDSPPPT